ncbi:MAG TPA: hypothetical protein GX401_04080 [Clostridiales bacterium]|nr:hypothetical protein [Clostridiales bacterium]
MTKNTMSIVKGVGAVMAVGAVAGYMGNKIMKKNPKQVKRKASQALQAMGEIVNDVSYILK